MEFYRVLVINTKRLYKKKHAKTGMLFSIFYMTQKHSKCRAYHIYTLYFSFPMKPNKPPGNQGGFSFAILSTKTTFKIFMWDIFILFYTFALK